MSSAAQFTANLANSLHSTGPVTEEGKRQSSQNALKHGLSAQSILLPSENAAEYEKFAAGILHDLGPENAIESALAQELVDLQWRLNRAARLEAQILSAGSPDYKALNSIGVHAARLKRHFSATLKEFLQLAQTRAASRAKNLKDAMAIRRADRIKNRPTDIAKFGFVYSIEEIDLHIQFEDTLGAARVTAAKSQFSDSMNKSHQ